MSNPSSATSKWLKKLQEDYRAIVRESPFYERLAVAASPADLHWIRQMYYLSCDFTAAVAIRYGHCHDLRFRKAFGEHAAEEVTHPQDLAAWMREFGFLRADEEPTSVPPILETLAYGGYFIRSVIREPLAHQIIVLNLMVEGMAYDWFAAMNPKLAELGLTPKGYWKVHQKADLKHQVLGLDLIPQHEPDSPGGQAYARIAWEVASLARQALDAWAGIPLEYRGSLPLPEKPGLGGGDDSRAATPGWRGTSD